MLERYIILFHFFFFFLVLLYSSRDYVDNDNDNDDDADDAALRVYECVQNCYALQLIVVFLLSFSAAQLCAGVLVAHVSLYFLFFLLSSQNAEAFPIFFLFFLHDDEAHVC